jgi:hypothetical protein
MPLEAYEQTLSSLSARVLSKEKPILDKSD